MNGLTAGRTCAIEAGLHVLRYEFEHESAFLIIVHGNATRFELVHKVIR